MASIRESTGDRVFNAVVLVIATVLLLIVLYPLIYIVLPWRGTHAFSGMKIL